MISIRISPRSDDVRGGLASVSGWRDYETDVLEFLEDVLSSWRVEELVVGDLYIGSTFDSNAPRLGSVLAREIGLRELLRIASGDGPSFVLCAPGVVIGASYGAVIFVEFQPELFPIYRAVPGRHALVEFAPGRDGEFRGQPVTTSASAPFWSTISNARESRILVRERFARGAFGARWMRSSGGALSQLAPMLRPRSLVSVFVDPSLSSARNPVEQPAVGLRLSDGEAVIAHKEFPWGVEEDDTEDLQRGGYTSLILSTSEPTAYGVVPDESGQIWCDWFVDDV
ncbi:hypothetical protein BJ988_000372 [Nocardioides panzhihuensis]|uniref:Uncharacterized protein n=1 Tax=Nocardioides panzhihuensis TaxID=860243 RepID=A0A7Z0IQ99_9ACTN|nr:hypothetical protein [Nocardioides panzhihuensis]